MEGEIIPSDTASLAHVERDPHQAAMLIWLQGKAAGIWRSYGTGLGAFLHTTEKHPSEIESLDVARSKEHPKWRGLADATVAQRLSAVLSLPRLPEPAWDPRSQARCRRRSQRYRGQPLRIG